jgi:type I restriction enzyme S subunit
MGEWLNKKLGEVITLQRGYDLPARERRAGSIPIVSSSGITGHHDVARADGPGVVIGRYGTLGEVHYLDQPYWPLNTSLFVIDFKGTHPRFVSYLLKMIDYGQQNAAGAVPGVNRNHLHSLDVRVPVVRDQKRIASVLSEYDDLIENNTKRIGVLEEMARVLYREWFVQPSARDPLPPGWSRSTFGRFVSLLKGTVTPNTAPGIEYDLFSFEACDQGRLPIATFGRSIQSNKFEVPDGVVLLPKLNPHIPRVWLPFLEGDRPNLFDRVSRASPLSGNSALVSLFDG